MEPFWEQEYESASTDPFGPPSSEILDLIPRIRPRGRILDLGCGGGRNAFPLAEAGFDVYAVDRSEAGIARLSREALSANLTIKAAVEDLDRYHLHHHSYDLVIAHGVLHLLAKRAGMRLLQEMQDHTVIGGWNVVALFTDRLPQPPDLAPFVLHPFREGEIRKAYTGWEIELFEAYTLNDEHSGGIMHSHPVNKLVARRVDNGATA